MIVRSAAAGLMLFAGLSAAQTPVTRSEAERAALAQGVRIGLARADSAAAYARLVTARALPNPTVSAAYSKSPPQKHLNVDIPVFDALYTRGARVGGAEAALHAARLLYASERLGVLVEVDTTYTAALAADAHFRLSRATARDADSLRTLTVRRRDAGDAADLDVDLAAVSAGQQHNTATNDSLSYLTALLTVQTLMGIPADSTRITLADSLVLLPTDTASMNVAVDAGGVPSVRAAEATLLAAERAIALQRRSIWQLPSLMVGVEWGDPAGDTPGYLPTFGISLPLPLLNKNQGPIAEAQAERERARIQLLGARLETRRLLVEGTRERQQLIAKVIRDRNLVVLAQRVADKSITAYREGASALPAVLEARRSAREVLSQYIDDLAALQIVNAELRALIQTVPAP